MTSFFRGLSKAPVSQTHAGRLGNGHLVHCSSESSKPSDEVKTLSVSSEPGGKGEAMPVEVGLAALGHIHRREVNVRVCVSVCVRKRPRQKRRR